MNIKVENYQYIAEVNEDAIDDMALEWISENLPNIHEYVEEGMERECLEAHAVLVGALNDINKMLDDLCEGKLFYDVNITEYISLNAIRRNLEMDVDLIDTSKEIT